MDPFTTYLPALEAGLRAVVETLADETPMLHGMLSYHLGWMDADFRPVQAPKGKRLRPVLLLLTCEAQGGSWREALPAAAAVELLHNFSLIHDDIEDRDRLRRGRPTVWAVWGEAQAINAGDAMFALGYEAILRLSLPAGRVRQAAQRYTRTILRLTQGQAMDIAFERQTDVSEAAYLKMVAGKTAALFGLSCELGGIVAGASPSRCQTLREFGEHLGMAFQMQDDLLGLWGDPARTGKPVGSDLRRGKKTLPILHGLARSQRLRELIAHPPLDDAQVEEGLRLLEGAGSREYTEARITRYHRRAMETLERTQSEGEALEAITALVQRLVGRDR